MTKEEVFNKIRGKMIVSCQGYVEQGSPFFEAKYQAMMAEAAYNGGARSGFRLNSVEHINLVKEKYPDIPVIGILKTDRTKYEAFITATMNEVDELCTKSKAEIIAIDGTAHLNYEGNPAYLTIGQAKKKYPDRIIMADCATFEDAVQCVEQGADIIATTMSGYTKETNYMDDTANFSLVKRIRKAYPDVYIICEGRLYSPQDVKHAFECGANTCVVGNAITGPHRTTGRFVKYLNEQGFKQ